MNRAGDVFLYEQLAGVIFEDEDGYHFQYDSDYLKQEKAQAISLTFLYRKKHFMDKHYFLFLMD